MSMADPSSTGPSSNARSSTRTRVKSQRAIESEHVQRLFTAAKNRDEASPSPAASAHVESTAESSKKKRPPVKKKKKKRTKSDTYCICNSDGEDGRPMIECGTCNDWFHFDCLGLSVDQAERIHEFVCDSCEEDTGKKTSHSFDLSIFPSPSPPPGFEIPAKRKSKKSKPVHPATPRATSSAPSVHSVHTSSSDDEGSAVESVSASSSDSASDAAEPAKKKIKQLTHRPVNAVDGRLEIGHRRPSGQRAKITSKSTRANKAPAGALPPARAFVLMKLGQVVSGLFKDDSQAEVDQYARDLEAGLWDGFKEVINSKDTAGGKYKGQFSLLNQSLNSDLRQDTLSSILNRTLTPTQVANLTNVELASSARLAELETAKQERLASIVKPKEDQTGVIRMGRDGLERAEDTREKEMMALRRAEEAQRTREKENERRESMMSDEGALAVDSPRVAQTQSQTQTPVPPSPAIGTPLSATRPDPLRKPSGSGPISPRKSISESPTLPTPGGSQRQFSLSSAWGKGPESEAGPSVGLGIGNGDQSTLDLSDIVVDNVEEDDLVSPEVEGDKTEMELFEGLPVVWTGGIINPAKASPHTPPIQIRHISTRHEPPLWQALLPSTPIEISGRVPTVSSTQYLESSRMTPTKELIVVAVTLDSKASGEEKAEWEGMIEFHIQKDRHALVHPYGIGKDTKPVQLGGAKEFYLIPLRPTDTSPSFTDLIDGYVLPKERTEPMFVGVFIANRPTLAPPTIVAPVQAASTSTPIVGGTTPQSSAIETQRLQALMASLNPQALQGVLGGITPPGPVPGSTTPQPPPVPYPTSTYAAPPHGGYAQQPYGGYQAYPHAGAGHGPPGPQGGYPGYEGQYRGDWDRGRDYDRGRRGGPPLGPPGGDRRAREWENQRDQGWGSRGGRGGAR